MKTKTIVNHAMIVLLTIFLVSSLFAGTSDEAIKAEIGTTIAVKVHQNLNGFKDYTADLTMTLINKNGVKNELCCSVDNLSDENDCQKSLIKFCEPDELCGTYFVNYSYENGEDENWINQSVFNRLDKIEARNKAASLLGSDFSYEDLSVKDISDYKYSWLRDELLNGEICSVVEYYPADEENSGYSRLVKWIDKDNFSVCKVEFYDRKDFHVKTLAYANYRKFQNKFWKAEEEIMSNHKSGKTTILEYSDVRFDVGLNDGDFSWAVEEIAGNNR